MTEASVYFWNSNLPPSFKYIGMETFDKTDITL